MKRQSSWLTRKGLPIESRERFILALAVKAHILQSILCQKQSAPNFMTGL
jgi:hypothetical protein